MKHMIRNMPFPDRWKIKKARRDVDMPDWRLYPEAISKKYYKELISDVIPMCSDRGSSRKSCVFGDSQYAGVVFYPWEQCPKVLNDLIDEVQNITGDQYDYCLVHLYQDGNSHIGWHNDQEANYHPVASLSLGATRKFRLRKLPERNDSLPPKGHDHEYTLQSGDLFVMKDTCQRKWEHTVPKEQFIRDARINVTFRIRES